MNNLTTTYFPDDQATDEQYIGKGAVTNNDTFIFPKNEPLTAADLEQFLNYHEYGLVPKYKKLLRYYKGKHNILNHEKHKRAPWKPDNRLEVNMPKKLVSTFNGFFSGTPVKISHNDKSISDAVTEFMDSNDFADLMSEVSEDADIYGHSYLMVFDDDSDHPEPHVVVASPLNTFVIYSNEIDRNPLYGVNCFTDGNGVLHGTLSSAKTEQDFTIGTDGSGLVLDAETATLFADVPIIECLENRNRIGIYADSLTLIDSLDKTLSEKANDVDMFGDSYLKIINASLDDKQIHDLREQRLINVTGENGSDAQVDFLAKPSADGTQENLINRLTDFIFMISSVVNLNDKDFGNASGVALYTKYKPMEDMANVKANKFTKSLKLLFKVIFSVLSDIPVDKQDEYQHLSIKFTQNVPHNTVDEANEAKTLAGIVSRQTQLAQLSFVDDPDNELDRIKQEQKQEQQESLNTFSNFNQQNGQVDQQKAGVNDGDNQPADEATDQSTDPTGQTN